MGQAAAQCAGRPLPGCARTFSTCFPKASFALTCLTYGNRRICCANVRGLCFPKKSGRQSLHRTWGVSVPRWQDSPLRPYGNSGPGRYKYASGWLQEGRASSFTHRGTCNRFCQGPSIGQHPVRCLAEVPEFFPVRLGHRTRHPGPAAKIRTWPSRSVTSAFYLDVSVNRLPSEEQAGSYFLLRLEAHVLEAKQVRW